MSDNWIQGAIHKPGAFKAKAQHAEMSTSAFAQKEKHASGKTGEQARLAATLMGLRKHADGAVVDPQKQNWFDKLRSVLMGKQALDKASGSAPPTPPPQPTSIDYVKRAAEDAGRRNDEEKKKEGSR